MKYLIVGLRRTVFVLIVYFICMTVVIAANDVIRQETTPMGYLSNQVSSLNTWRDQHQKADDEQFREIKDLELKLGEITLDREHRVTSLETQTARIQADLNALDTKMWVLIAGILAQLLKIGLDMITRRRKGRLEEEA